MISHLQHEDVPEKMQETLLFWQMLESDRYEVVISDITLMELKQCFEPKQSELLGYLGTINYALLPQTDEVDALPKLMSKTESCHVRVWEIVNISLLLR